jgi:ribosomal protein S18 acetylase RimI-like enzyme
VIVRPPTADDRGAVREALHSCGAFSAFEVEVAIGMFDEGLAGDYTLIGIEADGALRGYACIGHASLTERSWYLYWICVHPAFQGRGVGQALQAAVEDFVRRHGGDKLVLETSARAQYRRSRDFYEAAGFAAQGRIVGFYRRGEDCIVYCKALAEVE